MFSKTLSSILKKSVSPQQANPLVGALGEEIAKEVLLNKGFFVQDHPCKKGLSDLLIIINRDLKNLEVKTSVSKEREIFVFSNIRIDRKVHFYFFVCFYNSRLMCFLIPHKILMKSIKNGVFSARYYTLNNEKNVTVTIDRESLLPNFISYLEYSE